MTVSGKDGTGGAAVSRRDVLKGAAGVGAAAVGGVSVLGAVADSAWAQADLRKTILKIPGVGNGSPTDADWQKVGELCLGADQGQRASRANSRASSSPSWASTTRTCTTSCSAAS